MKTRSEITTVANGLNANLLDSLVNAVSLQEAEASGDIYKPFDEAHDAIASIVNVVESICIGTRYESVSVPKFLSSFKSFDADGKVDYIEVTIKSKLKAAYPYRKTFDVKVNDDFVENLVRGYVDALIGLYYVNCAGENVDELNERIEGIVAENELPISFGFTISDSATMIASIDNKKVIFNANIDSTFDIARDPLFTTGDAYADRVREVAAERLTEILKAIQTTPQIIKAGISLITDLTGVKTKKRAERLIRQAYHKRAIYFNKVKEGIGYYDETVKIGDEDVDIFAILKKNADGSIEVVLDPFNVKTLFTVDYDVVGAVKAALN